MTNITKSKEIFGWTGFTLALIGLFAYIVLLFDILLFKLGPWPSITGGQLEHEIVISQSYFWIQHENMVDQLLEPTFLGLIIWKFGSLGTGLGLSMFLRSFHELNDKKIGSKDPVLLFRNILVQEKKKIIIGIFVFLLLICSTLYYIYANKFEEDYGHGESYPLLESRRLILGTSTFIVFPLLLFYLGYKSIDSKNIRNNLG
ncbi:MAG: hypothetical protein ACFFDT_12415 [Candidatus Hodarchaeota archaeon]